MPYILEDLVVDRVDLVDEGANSAAFIEIFKRKESNMDFASIVSKLKPEHAAIINGKIAELEEDLSKARTDLETSSSELAGVTSELAKAKEKLAEAELAKAKTNQEDTCECDGEADESGICKECGKPKKGVGFDETETLKAMPENIRAEFLKMRAQKEAAEEQVRKNAEEKREAEAVAKAASLKALPVSQETLVSILKSCDQSVVDVLSTVAAAIDGVVLNEVGKSGKQAKATSASAWEQIEAAAEGIAQRDSITKQKAIGVVIKERPELYKEYLDGGAE